MWDGYQFEWNHEKAESNFRKHGITFEEATTAFEDPLAVLISDPDHSIEEQRFLLLGMTNRGRIIVVAFVERAVSTRLISARPATGSEQKGYEEEA